MLVVIVNAGKNFTEALIFALTEILVHLHATNGSRESSATTMPQKEGTWCHTWRRASERCQAPYYGGWPDASIDGGAPIVPEHQARAYSHPRRVRQQ